MPSEAKSWSQHSEKVEEIVRYFIDFFNMRDADDPKNVITLKCLQNLVCIIRLVSWVESKHGTAGPNQPARDPMQTGNPGDAWWQELTGQSGKGSRFIGGPGHPNFWANGLGKAFKQDLKARIAQLQKDNKDLIKKPRKMPGVRQSNKRYIKMYTHWLSKITWVCSPAAKPLGHKSPKFEPCMSYFWGILYLLHKVRRGQFYKVECRSCAKLLKKAIAYNGGGDPKYGAKLAAAAAAIKCCKNIPLPKKGGRKKGKGRSGRDKKRE